MRGDVEFESPEVYGRVSLVGCRSFDMPKGLFNRENVRNISKSVVSCRVVESLWLSLASLSLLGAEQRKRSKRSKTFTECLRYDTASKDSSAAVYTKINPGLWLHWLIGVKKVPRDDSNIPGTVCIWATARRKKVFYSSKVNLLYIKSSTHKYYSTADRGKMWYV